MNDSAITTTKPKCLILQRVIPSYRLGVFRKLSSSADFDISLVIGDDLKESKAKNADDLSGVNFVRLSSSAIRIFGRLFTIHEGLFRHLRKTKPDVILCEAESHFVGYWSAIFFKLIFSPKTKLILWCFYSLPGVAAERSSLHAVVKAIGRSFFDGYISYTTHGKKYLVAKGYSEQRINVAVNVCNTAHFLDVDAKLNLSKEAAKQMIGAFGKFVVSYIGTLDEAKRPGLLVEISKILRDENFYFQIVGGGYLEDELKRQVQYEKLINIHITGKVEQNLADYYRASDIVIIPGRGGIVISEAMCFGVPIIVHQADGVEYDLVINGHTGIIVSDGSAGDFASHLRKLILQPNLVLKMGENAKLHISQTHNTESMSQSIEQSLYEVLMVKG